MQIDNFLKELEGQFDYEDLKKLQECIWVRCKLSRKVLKDWDTKFKPNPSISSKILPQESLILGIRNRLKEKKDQDFYLKKEWLSAFAPTLPCSKPLLYNKKSHV